MSKGLRGARPGSKPAKQPGAGEAACTSPVAHGTIFYSSRHADFFVRSYTEPRQGQRQGTQGREGTEWDRLKETGEEIGGGGWRWGSKEKQSEVEATTRVAGVWEELGPSH